MFKTNKGIQKTPKQSYVLEVCKKETVKKILKTGAKPLKTHRKGVKTQQFKNQPELRKPQLLPKETEKEVMKVIASEWQVYIAKYP